jgi:hypothetical protein
MTRVEAINEERRRYLNAIVQSRSEQAHVHLRALHRLSGNGYCAWERHSDRSV